jgi:hypothetical protein
VEDVRRRLGPERVLERRACCVLSQPRNPMAWSSMRIPLAQPHAGKRPLQRAGNSQLPARWGCGRTFDASARRFSLIPECCFGRFPRRNLEHLDRQRRRVGRSDFEARYERMGRRRVFRTVKRLWDLFPLGLVNGHRHLFGLHTICGSLFVLLIRNGLRPVRLGGRSRLPCVVAFTEVAPSTRASPQSVQSFRSAANSR